MQTRSKYRCRSRTHTLHHLTLEQIKQVLEAEQDHALKTLLTIAVTTGMRRGELLALRWQDSDTENQSVHIHRIVSGNEEREVPETVRTLALPMIALRALKEHHQNQKNVQGETGQKCDLVFATASGQFYNTSMLRQQYHAVFVAIGLPHLSFHDLRYSAVATLVAMGVHLAVIQAILGVHYGNTTLKTLTPVSLSMQQAAMKKWDDLLEAE